MHPTRLIVYLFLYSIVIGVCSPISADIIDEEQAIAALVPLNQLSITNRVIAKPILSNFTLRRDYHPVSFRGKIEHLEFLLDHLDASAALAHHVGLITYRAENNEEGHLYANDGEGGEGFMYTIYYGKQKRVYFVEGKQQGFFNASGQGLAVVQYSQLTPDEAVYTGNVFVKVDNMVIATLVHMFSPFLRRTVDQKFLNLIQPVVKLCEMAQPTGNRLLEEIQKMSSKDQNRLKLFINMLVTNELENN